MCVTGQGKVQGKPACCEEVSIFCYRGKKIDARNLSNAKCHEEPEDHTAIEKIEDQGPPLNFFVLRLRIRRDMILSLSRFRVISDRASKMHIS
jgi:hypothetical protein